MKVNKSKNKIDFVVDQAFVDLLVGPSANDIMKVETFYQFYPLYHLYLLYKIIDQIQYKDECPEKSKLEKLGLNSAAIHNLSRKFKEEISVYRFIHSIMLNQIDSVKTALDQNAIKLQSSLENVSLFEYAGKAPIVYNFTYLTLAAALGRAEIVRLFIEKKASPAQMVCYDTVKPVPIPLSVNECLIMNAIYRWYKSGKKHKLKSQQADDLINTIILVSKIAPSIVSKDHLLEQGISIEWYWNKLKRIINDSTQLERLIPLNPSAFQSLLS